MTRGVLTVHDTTIAFNHKRLRDNIILNRPLVKSAKYKINFPISHPKHMLWVLKRTVSNETVLLSTNKHVKPDG